MPLLINLQSARRSNLLADGTAGTITAILLIPQALAYVLPAGLPPEVDLYASVLPMLVYALLGSSRTLSVGPVAVAAVMVATVLTPYAQGDAARYLSGALILAALSGLILLSMDSNRELLALDGTNIAAACVGAMPVCGGFARSMVNFDAGARTQLAVVITALWVALPAFTFTGLLAPLPKAVLAAIIVVAVWQLADFKALAHTWRYDRGDGAAQALTIAGVVGLVIKAGLMAGAGLSLGL